MSDDAERRIRLLYKGNEIFRMLAKTVGKARNEMIVKSAKKGTRTHYGLAGSPKGLSPHIKHERRKGKPIYDTQPTISVAQILRMLGAVLAPEGDPPPVMIQGDEAKYISDFNRWFERIQPKVIHAPTSRRVHIPTQSGLEMIEECRKLEKKLRSSSDEQGIDLTDTVSTVQRDANGEGPTVIIREDEMRATGHSVALSEDESRMIWLLEDNSVVELSMQTIEQVSEDLLHKMGLIEFFNQIGELRESRESE
jgi:hypothetical protein